MTALPVAIQIERVTVRCCQCDTVASLWVQNLAAWRLNHRCRVRPQGVIEANVKRSEWGAENGAGVSPGLENGAASAPAPSVPCAECGVELESFEIARIESARGSKFEQMCNDCCRLKLGLL